MAAEFRNEPISVDGLPRLADDDFVGVDPRHLWPWFAFLALVAAASTAVPILITALADPDPAWIPVAIGAVVLAGTIALIALTVIESRRLAYQLREHDLSYRSGAIGRHTATIPFTRVQHVTVTRGPIERWLGLATLGVNSAGPDLSIPGLTPDDAERLKLFIVERSDATVDDETADPAATAPQTGHVDTPSSPPLPPPPAPPAP